ncbi:MAG: hypothetical protein Q7U04_07320 [Bacteriovorax sp.]|nr:hypothetical protein [Bacteriovorax sp.]
MTMNLKNIFSTLVFTTVFATLVVFSTTEKVSALSWNITMGNYCGNGGANSAPSLPCTPGDTYTECWNDFGGMCDPMNGCNDYVCMW